MPSTRNVEYIDWACVGCGKNVTVDSPSTTPADFTLHGHVDLSSAMQDYSGGYVGPGESIRGDLCDACYAVVMLAVRERNQQ